jgi:hypothetical protein
VAVGILAGAAGGGCNRAPDPTDHHTAGVAEALGPAFFAAALRRAGGGHFHATTRLAAGADAAAGGVTTTTDVWVDPSGNYRLREVNDRDGGREVVFTGRELAVALRYGKMIRRAAEEPEPTRLLGEALGGPWAAWEIAGPAATVEPVGNELIGNARASRYRLSLKPGAPRPPAGAGLRAWRGSVAVGALSGEVAVDDASGAVMKADLSATFTAEDDGHRLPGAVEVHAALADLGGVPAIARPAAEDLALRQRTVPEQRELLSGLPSTHAAEPAAPARRPARRPSAAKAGTP